MRCSTMGREEAISVADNEHNRRAWFGPKRIGWGVRPQTWQGWLVTAAVIVVIVVLIQLVARH